jgi:hypothetical protein
VVVASLWDDGTLATSFSVFQALVFSILRHEVPDEDLSLSLSSLLFVRSPASLDRLYRR